MTTPSIVSVPVIPNIPRPIFVKTITRSSIPFGAFARQFRTVHTDLFRMNASYALRNAILPIITYLGPMIAYTLTGSFVVEKIFTIPGLGGEFIKAINGRDYTMIMGTTIFLAAFMVVMLLLVDIVYTIVDPRIKLK